MMVSCCIWRKWTWSCSKRSKLKRPTAGGIAYSWLTETFGSTTTTRISQTFPPQSLKCVQRTLLFSLVPVLVSSSTDWLHAPHSQAITAIEAESDAKSMIDDGEHNERESAHARNDMRKRNRQVRLAELRGGKYLSWVELNRRNPAPNPLAKSRESS